MEQKVTSLLDHPVYGLVQVDRLLALPPGTARRWIDGYSRGGKNYPPVVRPESSGEEIVTWGEFVETRLLAEYRSSGASILRMRPAVERLRERLGTRYPLAYARPFVAVAGRELVMEVQDEVGLERELRLVVIRNDQIVLSDPALKFHRSAEYRAADGVSDDELVVSLLRPVTAVPDVVIDPLRQFGEPVVRSVRTEIIAEQVRAGEANETIADLYDLTLKQVEAAVRYELIRSAPAESLAA